MTPHEHNNQSVPRFNLSVFKRNSVEPDKLFERVAIMQMQRQVKPFIESAPTGVWALPPPLPHTQAN